MSLRPGSCVSRDGDLELSTGDRMKVGRGRGRGRQSGVVSKVPQRGETIERSSERQFDADPWLLEGWLSDVTLAKRPAPDLGLPVDKAIKVLVNLYEVNFNYEGVIYLYRFLIQTRRTKALRAEERRAVFSEWLKLGRNKDDVNAFVFHPSGFVFGTKPLDSKDDGFGDDGVLVLVRLPCEVGCSGFKVFLRALESFSPSALPSLLSRVCPEYALSTLHIVESVLRQLSCNSVLQDRFVPVGNNIYRLPGHNVQTIDVGDGKEALYGLSISVRLGVNNKCYLNVDSTASPFFKEMNCVDAMLLALNKYKPGAFHKHDIKADTELEPGLKDIVSRYLKGLKVNLCYAQEHGRKPQTRKVTNIGEPARMIIFIRQEGDQEVKDNIVNYLESRYNLKVQYPGLPALVFGRGDRSMSVPIELCSIAAGQRSTREMAVGASTTMIRKLCEGGAPRRRERTEELANTSSLGMDDVCNSFSLTRSSTMCGVNGRVLGTPEIEHGNRQTARPSRGQWNPPNAGAMLTHVAESFERVSVLLMGMRTGAIGFGEIYSIVETLSIGAGHQGMSHPWDFVEAQVHAVPTNRKDEFDKIWAQMIEANNPSLVIALMPRRDPILYSLVKAAGDVADGVPTQCLLLKTVRPVRAVTMFNILLKINVKLGGANWQLQSSADHVAPVVSEVSDALILGVNVCHPGAREERLPSLAAVVGSVDSKFFRYGASVRVQPVGTDSNNYIVDCVKERVQEYQKYNNALPKKVFIFRDGVAQSQFEKTVDEELTCLRSGLDELDVSVPLTFVICQKHHHTRLFPEQSTDVEGRAGNVPAGTVVDTDVVDGRVWDFFLCSHSGIQGTSCPTHYTVLYDENDLSSSAIQRLTFYLCHLYAACTKSVKIPAPVYYAEKVTNRAKVHLTDFLSRYTTGHNTGELTERAAIKRHAYLEKYTKINNRQMDKMYFC